MQDRQGPVRQVRHAGRQARLTRNRLIILLFVAAMALMTVLSIIGGPNRPSNG